jgi:titin
VSRRLNKLFPLLFCAVPTEKIGNRDYVLTFDYVTLDDDAEYTAVAKNIAGEVRCTAQLIVEPETSDFREHLLR